MNVFYIPSWYPSQDHPLSGIFIQEQIEGLTKQYSDLKAGISIWGQKDEDAMLYLKEPLQSLIKVLKHEHQREEFQVLKENAFIFYNSAFTWTKKIANGNINNIIKANDKNFQLFESRFGKVQLIHAFITFPGGYIAMKLAEKYNLPYIITEEMSPFKPDVFMNLKRKINEQVLLPLEKAAKPIAVSHFSADQIQSYISSQVTYIPNMVDEDFFQPASKEVEREKFTFFTLGRMEEQKGIPVLLEAISKLKNKDILFKIGGDGEELVKYKLLGEQLSLDNIEWLGALNRDEAKLAFQNCNAFVLPSLHESMGVVFAEAIACGKPIVATKCGGPESIVNENNGLLAEVGDSADLANKIDRMVNNYDRYKAEVIREDFLERFSRKVVTAQIIKGYNQVINEQSPDN